jgi:ribose-phosphate pyrophosphokinase
MKDVVVLPGPSSKKLGDSIASCLDVDPVEVELRTFSDGESKIRINANLLNKKCVVVQSTYPPVDSHFLQTLMMLSYCNDSGASEVILVIPYMGYARQDRVFLDGEIVTISMIARLYEYFGTRNLITVDIHSTKALSYFNYDILNISSIPLLAKYAINNFSLTKPIIVSPDLGGVPRAKEFAEIMNASFLGLRKNRDRFTGNITIDEKLDATVTNRDIVILDDMVSSGGTILRAIDILKNNSCGRVFVMCVHALSDEKSIDLLKSSGISDIVSTNSIPRSCSKIDLSNEIAKTLSSILSRG